MSYGLLMNLIISVMSSTGLLVKKVFSPPFSLYGILFLSSISTRTTALSLFLKSAAVCCSFLAAIPHRKSY